MKTLIGASLIAISLAAYAPQAEARAKRPNIVDRIDLGRNSAGDPCVASRNVTDAAMTGYLFDSHSITCRGATAGRTLGVIRSAATANAAKIDATLSCGAATPVTIPGIGAAQASRCIDSVIGLQTVVTSFEKKGRRYVSSVIPSLQGPAEEALRIYAQAEKPSGDRNRATTAAVSFAALAPAPGADGASEMVAADPQRALVLGVGLIRQGLHMEASRILNDALGRLDVNAAPTVRAGLELEAGVADSNLRFFEQATQHFARADALLEANPGMEDAALLQSRRQQYAALDQLNRRDFQSAIRALDTLTLAPADPRYPLMDAVTVRQANQQRAGSRNPSSILAVPDAGSLSQIVIDAQANWARSVALLARNDLGGAETSLALADKSYGALRGENIRQDNILWLGARIDRQRARIAIQKQDWTTALSAYDRSIDALGRSGTGGAMLAEVQLDRAAVLARSGAERGKIADQFAAAVDSLIASGVTGNALPPSIEQYLDLLVQDAAANPDGPSAERFFRAVQAVGQPGTARQLSQLQNVVNADGALSSRVQDRSEYERELTRLRFELASGTLTNEARADLEKRRAAAETALIGIDTELQGNTAFRATDDKPATLAEMRTNLRDGEAYLKVTEVLNNAFAIVIDKRGTQIYRINAKTPALRTLAAEVRTSIQGTNDKLIPFEVGKAYALYALIAGPAAARLQSASGLIVEAAGPLETLPMGVLVENRASADAYRKARKAKPFDFTNVAFVARRATLSSALSARSFIVARNLAPSNAPQPFIGFAEHVPLSMTASYNGMQISIGTGCVVEKAAVAALSNQLEPISPKEIGIAETELGVSASQRVTGSAFSDTALSQKTDLDQFQVLHFATHGIPEGVWGCAKSPPALVTTFGDGTSDGLLSFEEVARLRLNANLVVLSACDTSATTTDTGLARSGGQEEAGGTMQGLVRAFFAANARAVLATYWQTSAEEETDQLIRAFYRTGRTADIGTALRVAQTTLMNQADYSHPFYWGAYFIVGDSSKTMLSGTRSAAQ